MTEKPVAPWIRTTLEFGPALGFVVTYLVFRDATFRVAGRDYSGFVAVTALFIPVFLLAAVANELVWRTQSETVWVMFETLVMPVVIAGFFVAQISLFVDHVTLDKPKKRR